MAGRLNKALAARARNADLGEGWQWSATKKSRVSSDNWRMTVHGNGLRVRPARALRRTRTEVFVPIGEYAIAKMIVLTYVDGIESVLQKKFREGNR